MVTRSETVFNVKNFPNIKAQLLNWARASMPIAWYDSNDYPHLNNDFDAILALERVEESPWLTSENDLKSVLGTDWLFGFFSYEYNATWEQVTLKRYGYLKGMC